MNQPSLDNMLEKVDSRYTLVTIVAKRARALTGNVSINEEGELAKKPVTSALFDIAEGRISYIPSKKNRNK